MKKLYKQSKDSISIKVYSIIPVRIDQSVRPHAFSILDEILRAIDDSSPIIANLSSSNNVYHEIDCAMGIARTSDIEPPIILLYKNDTVFKRKGVVGFNLRGTSQLRFTTYKELMDQLTRRLDI